LHEFISREQQVVKIQNSIQLSRGDFAINLRVSLQLSVWVEVLAFDEVGDVALSNFRRFFLIKVKRAKLKNIVRIFNDCEKLLGTPFIYSLAILGNLETDAKKN
jgi:hypothetical protein